MLRLEEKMNDYYFFSALFVHFHDGGGRYANLRPNSNVKLLIYRTKYLFGSTQMIQVRRLIN